MAYIHVEEQGLKALAEAIDTAGTEYKEQLNRLEGIVKDIAGGAIKGDMAEDIQKKFEAKQDILYGMSQVIEDAYQSMSEMGAQFAKLGDYLKGQAG